MFINQTNTKIKFIMFVPKQLVKNISTSSKHVNVLITPILRDQSQFLSSEAGILNSGLPDLDIPRVSLNEFVFENIHKWENKIAIKCAETGRKYTYKEFEKKSGIFGAALRKKLKLNKGDVVTILSPNVPEFPIAALGALRGGLVCTTVNPIYKPEEISIQLLDCSAKAIITLAELWPLAKRTREIMKKNIPIITVKTKGDQQTPPGAINFSEFTENTSPLDVSISSDEVAFLPYSSGTTGLPKGVQLTHYNVVSNVSQLSHPEIGASRQTSGDHQDITPAVLPMFHIYGLTVLCMYQLRLGCQIVSLPKFVPERLITTLTQDKASVLYVAPPIAIFLAKNQNLKPKDFDSLRTIVNGAAPLGPLDAAKLQERAGRELPIIQGYGLTETSPAVLFYRNSFLNIKSAAGSLGTPLPNTEVKLVAIDDPTGTPLGPNTQGELFIRGPQVMKGYHNRPEENPFQDGWLRTGDMMYYNDDGYLFITDRVKELIKVKGFQVAPAELEELIRNYPNVSEAAVIGIPHSTLGEVPRAYLVPQDGAQIDCKGLLNYVKEKAASYKQLAGGIVVVESIPKNASGKILRRQLKLLYQQSNQ